MDQWIFSHTQLSLYRLCPRRYYEVYVLGNKEPSSVDMEFSSWLVHKPLELHHKGQPIVWEDLWREFSQAVGDAKFGALDLDLAQQIYKLYLDKPINESWETVAAEEKLYTFVEDYRYVSKPDLVAIDPSILQHDLGPIPHHMKWTVDFKFTQAWEIKPLLPYDDQLLGQAITHQADGFLRYTFHRDKKTGKLKTVVEGHLVDPVLAEEWKYETLVTIHDIETDPGVDMKTNKAPYPWPKNTNSCYAYGRPCPFIHKCKVGLTSSMDGVK